MKTSSWLRSFRNRSAKTRAAARPAPHTTRPRLAVETLEDRSVPAAFDPTFGAGGALQMGGDRYDYASRMDRDAAGNLLMTGSFASTADFDTGPGVVTLTSQGLFDGFIAKYSPTGELIWARHLGGAQSDHVDAMALDAAGNVFVGVRLSATADLDPANVYIDNRDIVTGTGACVVRYNADGSFAWVWRDPAAGAVTYVKDLEVDGAGNVVAFGDYPNPTSSYIASAAVKLDDTGTQLWRRNFVGSQGAFVSRALTLDDGGNVFLLAAMIGSIDVNPGAQTLKFTSANMSTVVEKLTANGDFVWAKQVKGTDRVEGYDIAVDGAGNIVTAGYYEKTADFDPGKAKYSLTAPAGGGTFVSKLDASGNFVWARSMGAGINVTDAYHLALDAAGGIYVGGHFDGSGDFDTGAGTHTLTSAGEWDGFVAKLEANGDFAWALRMGGAGGDSANSLLVDADGSVLVCGGFAGTADFGDLLLTSSGETDMFLARITQP